MDQTIDQIPIGTKVKIVDRVPRDKRDHPVWLSPGMDRCLGREGEVVGKS